YKNVLSFLGNGIYAHFFAVAYVAFKSYNTVDFCIKSIVSASANVRSRVNFCSPLTVQNGTACHKLTVSTLCAKALGNGVTTVLGRTYSLFRCEKLQIQS